VDFRAAEPADIQAVARLLLRASPGRQLEREAAYVAAYFEHPETVLTIAVTGDEPAGVVSFEPSLIRHEDGADEATAYLRLIAVDPARWGSGLAADLLERARTGMAAAGFRRAYLWCGAANLRARRFYEREGWSPDGRVRQHEDWGPMVAYTRELGSA
jgi:GNAT superfamily N-acetyltransferase